MPPPLLLLPLLLLGGWTLVGPAGCDPTSTPPPLADAVPADTDHPEPGSAAAGSQVSASLHHILEEAARLRQVTVRAATSGPLSEIRQQLDAIRAKIQANEDSIQQQLNTIRVDIEANEDSIERQLDVIRADIRRIPKPVLGQSCNSDADCSTKTPEATCGGDGLCSCRDGYRRVSDFECRRNSRLFESCLEDADCWALAPNSSCTGGVCGCTNGFWTYNNTECRPVGAVSKYDTCVGDEDCEASLDRRCVSGVCNCLVKTVGIYEYRLANGPSCKEGNVQLRRNGGSWGLVCDDSWDNTDARVLCWSLGFSSGRATWESRYGRGSNFYLYDVYCRGSESHLKECGSTYGLFHDCGDDDVAGVICRN